jgi:Asp-tRNA(Asn)/Glu-tRNA(Gln) amidotransferase A subunit family amidase
MSRGTLLMSGIGGSTILDGLSVGLQIVGRRLEEEKVLGVAHQIERLL